MSVGEVSALIADGSLQWKQYQAPPANTAATAGNQAGSSVAGTTAPTAAPTDGDDGRHRRNHDQVVIQTKQLDAAEKKALESEAAFEDFLNAQTTQNEEIAALFQKQYGTSARTKCVPRPRDRGGTILARAAARLWYAGAARGGSAY